MYLKNKDFLFSLILSVVVLCASLVGNFYAGTYATEKAGNAVTDIILNNIPVYDIDGIFIYGALIFWIFLALIIIAKPQRIPFTLKCISLFVVIRSFFIILTHIGPFPVQTVVPAFNILDKITFTGDLFFSGHTGLPFLLALIFWNNRFFRYFFLAASVLFAVVVILGHLHYSIDVFGAYFITYSIFHIGELFFKKDRKIFDNGLNLLLESIPE